MRSIDEAAIAASAEERFRSEYHYALFEYLRSAKVIRALERAGKNRSYYEDQIKKFEAALGE